MFCQTLAGLKRQFAGVLRQQFPSFLLLLKDGLLRGICSPLNRIIMLKLFLLLFFFLLSLLILFRAPAYLLWYASILVTEFSWVFILLVATVLCWPGGAERYRLFGHTLGLITIVILLVPYVQGWRLSRQIDVAFSAAFKNDIKAEQPAFDLFQILTGIRSRQVAYETLMYDSTHHLTLDFYRAEAQGERPCVIVIHGGSWSAGDSRQLPELNSELAKEGYHVASIQYRLAPQFLFPAPVEDVYKALRFLQKQASALSIDASNVVLLGRSAGGQVALSAAYARPHPAIKGVINFYGPTDMVWGYANPTNPLVLDSRKVMENYLGGSYSQVPQPYIRSSATETVSAGVPPTLMIFGENDPLVSPRHGTRLAVKLRAMNVPHFTLYLPWATHGFDYTLNGPAGQLSTWVVKCFLKTVLPVKAAQ